MNVAIYARVSSHKQDVALQTSALRDYCRLRGYTIAQEYIDHAYSGAKQQRPALIELMAAARAKAFDAICCWKWDRFGRSTLHLAAALQEFQSLGIHFLSVTEGTDTSTPTGKLLFTIMSAVAEFERDLIRERGRAGMAAARERLASGPYRRAKDQRLVTSLGRPTRALDMQLAQEMISGGMTVAATAKLLNVPHSTLRDRLKGLKFKE